MDDLFVFLFNMLLHPRVVHFPIALLLTGVFLIFSNELIKKTQLNDLSIKMIVIGWILSIPAILTGLVEQNFILNDDLVKQIVNKHITFAFAMWIFFGLALYFYFKWNVTNYPKQKKMVLLIILAFAAFFLVITAHLGSELVYKFGVGVF